MNTNKQVKIHTKQIDPYTPVVGITADNTLEFVQYGELGCGPYVLVEELFAALQTQEDRPTRIVDLMERGYTYCWYRRLSDDGRYVVVFDPQSRKLTDGTHDFQTITEAFNYVLDMEEEDA